MRLNTPSGARGCRLDSMPTSHFRAPARTRRQVRSLYRRAYDRLHDDNDPAVRGMRDCEVRNGRSIVAVLYRTRDFDSGINDQSIPALARAARFGVATVKNVLSLLWRLGFIERIPRRVYDDSYRPAGWSHYGAWRQATNAYLPVRHDGVREWPAYTPPSDEWVASGVDPSEPEIEVRPGDWAKEVVCAPAPTQPSDFSSEAKIWPPSFAVNSSSSLSLKGGWGKQPDTGLKSPQPGDNGDNPQDRQQPPGSPQKALPGAAGTEVVPVGSRPSRAAPAAFWRWLTEELWNRRTQVEMGSAWGPRRPQEEGEDSS